MSGRYGSRPVQNPRISVHRSAKSMVRVQSLVIGAGFGFLQTADCGSEFSSGEDGK
jgi:hypothetical protein